MLPFSAIGSDHVCVLKSKNKTSSESWERAAKYRPSGDQRGLNKPSEPGIDETWRVFTSAMSIVRGSDVPKVSATPPKAIWVPSGDQVGSSSSRPLSGSSSCGVPPCGETTKIFHLLPWVARNAIRFPSGDQRGRCICTGGYVSCNRSLPSERLRHN